MDQNQYPKIFSFSSWWIFIYGFIFFVLINGICTWYFFLHPVEHKRLPISPTYGEISEQIQQIKKEKKPVIVFLGASAMWGAWGTEHADQTIPLQVQAALGKNVSVYNFSFPSARPLDQFALVHSLKNSGVDTFVIDISPQYFSPAYNEGLHVYRSQYLRIRQLITTQYKSFFGTHPEAAICLSQYQIQLTPEYPLSYRWLPVVRYKQEINTLFFGRHFSFMARAFIDNIINKLQQAPDALPWHNIFFALPTQPGGDDVVRVQESNDAVPVYSETLNSCIARTMSKFIVKEKIPALLYITPLNPVVIRKERLDPQFEKNIQFVRDIYGSTLLQDFTNLHGDPAFFIDRLHMKPAGHRQTAETLAEILRTQYGF